MLENFIMIFNISFKINVLIFKIQRTQAKVLDFHIAARAECVITKEKELNVLKNKKEFFLKINLRKGFLLKKLYESVQ